MKGGGGEEGKRVKERARGCDYAKVIYVQVYPQRCGLAAATLRLRLGRRESDFAFQATIEGREEKAENVQVVALRWHSSGNEVRLGLPVGLKKKTQK